MAWRVGVSAIGRTIELSPRCAGRGKPPFAHVCDPDSVCHQPPHRDLESGSHRADQLNPIGLVLDLGEIGRPDAVAAPGQLDEHRLEDAH
jgi:hypothetical protein